jgi:hypothetical protein
MNYRRDHPRAFKNRYHKRSSNSESVNSSIQGKVRRAPLQPQVARAEERGRTQNDNVPEAADTVQNQVGSRVMGLSPAL